jgi:hypothetical protein
MKSRDHSNSRREILFRKFDTNPLPSSAQPADIPAAPKADMTAEEKRSDTPPNAAANKREILFRKFVYKDVPPKPEKAPSEKPEGGAAVIGGKSGVLSDVTSDRRRLIKGLNFIIVACIILLVFIFNASRANHKKYFLTAEEGAVEIWRGTFTPLGKERLMIMPGMQPPPAIKGIYTREEAFNIIAAYYIEESDALLDIPGMPDFKGIKTYLHKSLAYASSPQLRRMARSRLKKINLMVLEYKADIAVAGNAREDLETALNFLKEAFLLELDPEELDRINSKIKTIRGEMARLEKEKVKPPKAPVPPSE